MTTTKRSWGDNELQRLLAEQREEAQQKWLANNTNAWVPVQPSAGSPLARLVDSAKQQYAGQLKSERAALGARWREMMEKHYNDIMPSLYQLQFEKTTAGGSNVQTSGQCQQISRLDVLLSEEDGLLAQQESYNRHSIPVPPHTTKRLADLQREIGDEWRAQLDRDIAAREREVDELRTREEKRETAVSELEKLRGLREQLTAK